MSLLDDFLGGFLRWRQHRAGHWERWIVLGGGQAWFRLEGCAHPRYGSIRYRPAGVHGTPECEEW